MPPPVVLTLTARVAATPVTGLTTASSSPGFGSLSLVSTLPLTDWLISVVLISSSATGGLSNTLIVIVAVSVLPLPSSITYGI